MAAYYEEKVNFLRESVVVCIPHELYKEFLDALFDYNEERAKHGLSTCNIESLRPNVKRLTKGALTYENFRGAYF